MSHENKIMSPEASGGDVLSNDGDDDLHLQLNLRLRLDEVVEVEAVTLRSEPGSIPSDSELRDLAKRIYGARRMRDKILDHKLFGEPAWDMLLALSFMPRQGRLLSVSGLCATSGAPATTALRWQDALTREGLIERGPDEADARRKFIRLTDRGRDLMRDYLSRLYAEAPKGSSSKVDF